MSATIRSSNECPTSTTRRFPSPYRTALAQGLMPLHELGACAGTKKEPLTNQAPSVRPELL